MLINIYIYLKTLGFYFPREIVLIVRVLNWEGLILKLRFYINFGMALLSFR